MKRLKPYYLFVGVPILLVTLGFVFFADAVANTIRGNPHPQINYLIFALMAVGGGMMLHAVHRMNREGTFIQKFFRSARDGASPEALRDMLEKQRHDVGDVLELLAETQNAPISAVQHAALESELHRFEARQAMRLYLPQFLSGAMVGLGLLGTFIGLLGALEEIGKLISAFTMVDSGNASAAVRVLVDRLSAPMRAMGVAFSASLFGVLGSLIMSVLMVGVKRCSSELVGAVHARLVYLTDFSGKQSAHGGAVHSDELASGLNALAEHSPVLKALVNAMEQSERRVRDLITSIGQLTSKVERNEVELWVKLNDTLRYQWAQQQEVGAQTLKQITDAVQSMRDVAREVPAAAYRENAVIHALSSQQAQMQQAIEASQTGMAQLMQAHTDSQGELVKTLAQHTQALAKQDEASREAKKIYETVVAQQRSIDQSLHVLSSSFAGLDDIVRRHQDNLQRQQSGDTVQARELATALREEGVILNRLIERIESLHHEQAAQSERQLTLLMQEWRQGQSGTTQG